MNVQNSLFQADEEQKPLAATMVYEDEPETEVASVGNAGSQIRTQKRFFFVKIAELSLDLCLPFRKIV